jgi:DNA polymerase III delta subunit
MAKAQRYVPFLLAYGAEDYLLDQDRQRILAWKGRDVVSLDGDKVTETEIVDACQSVSLEGQGRLILVDHAEEVKVAKVLPSYVEGRAEAKAGEVLVVIVRGAKLPEAWAKMGRHGKVTEHRKLKTWDNNNEVVRWLVTEAVRLGASLGDGVADRLFSLIGDDLYVLASELGKLVRLAGGKKVEMADLTRVVAPVFPASPFEVGEAALGRQAVKAMDKLSLVYRTLGDEAHVPIVIGLMRPIEKALVARQMLDARAPEEEIALAVGMNPWRCRTHFLPMVRRHTTASLVGHMARLRRLDVEVKGSVTSKRTRVELTVLAIAG